MKRPLRIRGWVGAAALLGLASTALTACSGGASPDPTGPVEIVIGNQPAATETARLAQFNALVETFKKDHPTYVVTTTEDGWDAQTFSARLAAGDLPTVMGVPFTEIRGLIERKQVADITDAVDQLGVTAKLNPQLVDLVSADGRSYGVPTMAYAMGLVYNRALFTAAGLDPDSPPTTWDEVRTAAKTIHDKTGAYGFAQVTTDNQGGWVLGAEAASRGGSLVNDKGDQITFDDSATTDALRLIHDMRWTDASMSPNGLMAALDLAQAFAGRQVGMFVLQSDAYRPLTEQLGFPGSDFGFAAMPTATAGQAPVTLSGGNIEVVRPDASPAQVKAAVEWVQLSALAKYESKDAAQADAKALATQGSAVAIPGLPVVTSAAYDQYLSWISDLNNVPLANFRPYLDKVAEQKVQSEPPVKGQDIYATLDPVVQAVITDQNADIGTLVSDAAKKAQAVLSR
ncbi:ABC transporter substrate-binding protein [Microbacterium sp. B24]|uniref:ABC transporter substrate-binding protein n=1 Tax=Microbacterium sp. B24 TaxID=95616 RepID=UPI0005654E94|nr:extracellular solute-binding protein [Microbacterium sp. B24]